jgi:hypothetical protein
MYSISKVLSMLLSIVSVSVRGTNAIFTTVSSSRVKGAIDRCPITCDLGPLLAAVVGTWNGLAFFEVIAAEPGCRIFATDADVPFVAKGVFVMSRSPGRRCRSVLAGFMVF